MKLDSFDKAARKEMRAKLPRGSSLAYSADSGVAALLVRDSNVDRVFTAVHSMQDADPASRKVGEFLALQRWDYDPSGGALFPTGWWDDAKEFLTRNYMTTSHLWSKENGTVRFDHNGYKIY